MDSTSLPTGGATGAIFWSREPGKETVRLAASGDILLESDPGGAGESVLDELRPVFREADLVFANLECTLTATATEPFMARLESAAVLARGGFTHLHLANNHTSESGPEGLGETLEALAANSLRSLGAGHSARDAKRLHIDQIENLRIGWLAAGRTLRHQSDMAPAYWELDEDELLTAVTDSAPHVDVLVISLHAGYMLVEYPSPELRSLARRLCDAGAHLVLMHHPHVLQGIEVIDERKVVCYSLGNLLFDWRSGRFPAEVMVEEQNEGAVFVFELDDKGVSSVSLVPTWIEDRCRVRLATGDRAARILARVERLSSEIQGDYLPLFEHQRATNNTGLAVKTVWNHLKRGEFMAALRLLGRIRPRHVKMLLSYIPSRFSGRTTG